MAETSDSAAGNDPQTSSIDQDAAQGSSDSFWHNVYSRNQDKASTSQWGDSGNGLEFAFGSSVKGAGVSSLDYEWGHGFEKSSKKKRKKKYTDVSSSSALNSPSDLSLSGALSQISKDLSLSSPSLFSSGEIDGDRENEEADLLKSHGQNLQAEKMDTSAIPAFIHYLSECNGVDMLSSDSDGDEDEIQATSVFGASESKDSCQEPEIGMEFSSEEEAYRFYEGYANKIGFRTRKGKVQRLSNGAIRKRFFFCSKQGFRLKKQADKITKYKRKETRTGCDAKIQFTVENGKWVVSQFNQEHNHHLENQRHITRSCTETSEARLILTENNAEMAKDAGAPKSTDLCNMVCSTSVHDKTRDGKHPEEVQNLLNYLRHLQVEDLSFFYAVQLDSNNRLKNLFWRDGRSMVDYDYFGDVLILDTTFRMDKYDIICAPFWGLNHHRQYVMFGCAFLLDESKESFVWLLETFMEAMGRKQPKTIVTDENQVMVEAVKVVLLDAEHQFGAWFIRRNALKHVFAFYSQPAFESIFNACISDCQTEEEFESKWDFLLKKFNLRENAWLNNLYLSRERWANVFHKGTFSAGIKWCKDIINVFQNSTGDTTNMSMFVHQYLKVVETQRLEELYEDLRCGETTKVLILSGSAMEKQAANIYTRTIFSIFEGELVKSLSVAIEEIARDWTSATFKLTEEGQKENIVEFSRLDSILACSCKKYESEGILCVHALKVLNARNIFDIPAQYILKRWTICAKDSEAEDEHGQKLADQKQQPMIFLLKKTLDVIYKTSAFEDCQKIVMHSLNKASRRVEAVLRARRTDHLKSRKGLRRTGKSCRLRWLNYLKPDVKRGNLTPQEQLLILELHSKWGNRWSKIAQHLPGRTDNEIKNYWRTRVQKQARHLRIDANSTAFQGIIRCFWIPRLLQKIGGSSAPSAMITAQNPAVSQPIPTYAPPLPTFPPALPPLPQQDAPLDMSVIMHCMEHRQQTSDSMLLLIAESMNVSQMSQLSEYPTSPFQAIGSNSDYSNLVKDCYYVDSNCYDMESINLATMSVPGELGISAVDRHMGDGDWSGYDFGDNEWNMDELWPFRNLQGKET